MITITIIAAILALAIVGIIFWRERDEIVKENIRQNRLICDLDELCARLARERNEALHGYRDLTASYTVTDSDTIKYSTDEEMEAHIEKHLLKTIVADALRDMDFSPEVAVNVDGYKVYSYNFHIKQV